MPLKGYKHTQEHNKNVSEAKKGKPSNFKGKNHSEESKKKISESRKGIEFSEEHRRKLSDWGKRRVYSKEFSEKMSLIVRGKNNPNWNGGSSFEGYPIDWTETLRRSIRERDRYTCQVCLKQQTEETFSVHHIDYNKQNCNPDNLITLCNSCHVKTNKNRDYWKDYFKKATKVKKI